MDLRRCLLLPALMLGGCAIPLQYHSSGLMAPIPHDGPGHTLCTLSVSLADPELMADPSHGALEAQMQAQIAHFIRGDGRFVLNTDAEDCAGTELALTFTDITDVGNFEVYADGMPMTLTAVADVRYWRNDQAPASAQQFTRSSVMEVTPELDGDLAGTNLLFINSVRNKTRLMESILAELQIRVEAL
ncbi:hypothetical protein KUV89_15530 [Marinobacter hydrocarbonoclasticus]|nr:hypothetical protein [Marinobacter nauticus]